MTEVLAKCTKETGHVLHAEVLSTNSRLNRINPDSDNCFAAIATDKKEECSFSKNSPLSSGLFLFVGETVVNSSIC